jgi:hypothetical protein
LIARYPNVVVYARKKTGTPETLYALFQGLLPPDVGFYGFNLPIETVPLATALLDWEFVIQERPGELRFANPDDLEGNNLEVLPTDGAAQFVYTKDNRGHLFALKTIRRPTRVVIDGSDLVTSA